MSQSEDTNQNNRQTESIFIEDENSHFYLSRSSLAERDNQQKGLLKTLPGGKSIWDWLELLIIPLLVAIVTGVFTYYANERQNKIATQISEAEDNRNQVALLTKYLDEISRLVEERSLLTDEDNSETSRTIARARTLTILRALDSDRKGELIQFLGAAELINKNRTIIDLNQADLSTAELNKALLDKVNLKEVDLRDAKLQGAELVEANLRDAKLQGADLQNAKLQNINLAGANLSGEKTNLTKAILRKAKLPRAIMTDVNLSDADLREADLRATVLQGANLSNARSSRADLSDSDLRNANFQGADLQGADLRDADLTGANITASQLKMACNSEQAELSEKLEQELSSAKDPQTKPDCDQWKRK